MYLTSTKKFLKRFGSSHFSHDLMSFDFNKDGYVEILDYFYGEGKPSAVEICDLRTKNGSFQKNW